MSIFDELETEARELIKTIQLGIESAFYMKDSWIHYDEFDAERQRFATYARCFAKATEIYTNARIGRRFWIGIVDDLDGRLEEMKKELGYVKRDLGIQGEINVGYETRRLRREYRDYD